MNKSGRSGVSLGVKRSSALIALALVACTTTTEPQATTTSTTVPVSTTTTTTVAADLPGCVPGNPKIGIDLQYEAIIEAYRIRNPERLADLIGDGPVLDPSLEPEGPDLYPDLAAWLAAASRMTDQWSNRGYGFGEPFQLFLQRRNPSLRGAGIDGLDITFEFWLTQDCELRVATTDIISSPDPCRYFELYDREATPAGCLGPFEPRASHAAVWTGEEILIYGGTNGSDVAEPLRRGVAYNPETGAARDISPSPRGFVWWNSLPAFWVDDRMIIPGRTYDDEATRVVVMSYMPAEDSWQVSSPLPSDRLGVGAVVWTGEVLLFVGGDNHYPEDSAWAYSPERDQWRQLPDPGIEPVEELRGVWAGEEAIFFGGYAADLSAGAVAYDPDSDTWRHLSPSPGHWIQYNQLAWTGSAMIVYSGHTGPGHPNRLLIYQPATDSWSESSPMPMLPAERLAGAWTGDRLIIWGGYATYGEHDEDGDAVFGHGAMYDPVTDTWELMAPAPISDRCDHSGTWTGTEFIVFGGMPLCGTPGILPLGDGAAYDPTTNTWGLLEK